MISDEALEAAAHAIYSVNRKKEVSERTYEERWPRHRFAYKVLARAALEAAGQLQAAKPRQITTAVELAALPRYTVIRSAEGSVLERQTMWHEAGSRDLKYWTDIALPATVLQLGWGEE